MTVILSCIQREVPPGLSKRDARILKSVKKRAHYLDTGLNICGFRVGWTFFVGASGPYLLSAIPSFNPAHKIISRCGSRCGRRAQCSPWLLPGHPKGQTSRVERHSITFVTVPDLIVTNLC